MSEHAAATEAPAAEPGFLQKHHFLIRRLHSLSGIIPVGAFLVEHLFTSSAILMGPEHYQKDINFIWGLPGLVLMEIFAIWLPIAFHASLGIVYSMGGLKYNTTRYPYQDNWRYTWQRITGFIALIYIFFHISTTRWGWTYGGLWASPFDAKRATTTTIEALQLYWWVPWFYAIGLVATVFHFANGLWTAAITWGLTVSVAAQKRWGYVCAAVGVMLAAGGLMSIARFSTMDRQDATVIAAETHEAQGPPVILKFAQPLNTENEKTPAPEASTTQSAAPDKNPAPAPMEYK